MKISPTINTSPAIKVNPTVPARSDVAPVSGNSVARDVNDVSPEARMLARNQRALSEQLRPRPEVMKKFSSTIDSPVDLPDRTIERIMQNLQSA